MHGNSPILGNSQKQRCPRGSADTGGSHIPWERGSEGGEFPVFPKDQPGSSSGQGEARSAFPGIGSSAGEFPKSLMWMLCSMGMGQGCPGSAGEGSSSASRAVKVQDLQAQPSPGCPCPNPRGFSRRKRGSKLGAGWEEGRTGEGMPGIVGLIMGKDGSGTRSPCPGTDFG